MLKLSILTATYNRAELLPRLYKSIVNNLIQNINIQWLIMDDGSQDNTKEIIRNFGEFENLEIKYYFQKNSGKMTAINNLVKKVDGQLIIECDSDDYFENNSFKIIQKEYEKNKQDKQLYAMCFLKYDKNGNNIGNKFKCEKTTMFDLYFKQLEDGEKALVYISSIRKQYQYKLENKEKFVTEARMHHQMDLKYKIKCINKPIMICEYQKEGYTKNIQKIFKQNPYGYYKYFKEILDRDMKGVKFKKRLYVIKHYILFTYLTKNKLNIKQIKNIINKILVCLLYVPGIIKSSKYKSKKITHKLI